jgi:hypothetical protein
VLDEATRRRFTLRFYVALPDSPARGQILQRAPAQQGCALSERELAALVQGTQGFSGGELGQLCQQAAAAAGLPGLQSPLLQGFGGGASQGGPQGLPHGAGRVRGVGQNARLRTLTARGGGRGTPRLSLPPRRRSCEGSAGGFAFRGKENALPGRSMPYAPRTQVFPIYCGREALHVCRVDGGRPTWAGTPGLRNSCFLAAILLCPLCPNGSLLPHSPSAFA